VSGADALLAEAHRRGIELWADGASLRYRAPPGALTPDLREALRATKAEVLRVLADAAARPPAPAASRCRICGRAKFELAGRLPRCFVCDSAGFTPEAAGG